MTTSLSTFKPVSELAVSVSDPQIIETGSREVIVYRCDKVANTFLIHQKVGRDASVINVILVDGMGDATIELLGEQEEGSELTTIIFGQIRGTSQVTITSKIETRGSCTKTTVQSRLVLFDEARAKVRSLIIVASGVRGVHVEEHLYHLIIGAKARVECIPELDVATDGVTGSHTATITRAPVEAKWYLEARGINTAKAEELLATGFLCPVFEDYGEFLA